MQDSTTYNLLQPTWKLQGIDLKRLAFEYSLSGDENGRFPYCLILDEDESKGTFNVAIFRFTMDNIIAELPQARTLQIQNAIKVSDLEFVNRPF